MLDGIRKNIFSLSKSQLVIPYVMMWIAVSTIHFFIMFQVYKLTAPQALGDSLVYNGLFAIMGTGLWFMTRYSDIRKKKLGEILIFHVTGVTVTLLIWLGAAYLLLNLLFESQPAYRQFLKDSLVIRIISGVLYYGLLVSIAYLIISFRELKEKMEHEAQLKSSLRDAELNLLRSQIRPHFLFNSLNSISALTISNPDKAQDMIIKLSEYMRYSLNQSEEILSDLKKELYHTGLYLDIEKVRFGDRLVIAEEIDEECQSCTLPAMILQPLIENAIKHGVYGSTGQVKIHIKAHLQGDFLRISISNNFDPVGIIHKGSGTGLKNVENRLLTFYYRHDLLKVSKQEQYFEVFINIPQNG
jgi:sensor histidine kinase YesM